MSENVSKLVPYVMPMSDMLSRIYPVGSIYMSVTSASPADLFGGTWERIKDRFLLASGDSYSAGSTGGEAQHKLEQTELPGGVVINRNPTKRVGIPAVSRVNMTINPGTWAFASNFDFSQQEGVTLCNTPHNNMPPYLTVYIWKRVA